MKVAITRFVMLAAIAALVVMCGATASWAQCPTSPNFTPDFSLNQNCLTLNSGSPGSGYPGFYPAVPPPPPGVTTVLRLTPNSTYTSGSAWFNTQQPVAGAFTTTFTFQLSGTSDFVADGIAFVIQNSPAGLTALDAGGTADGCGIGFGDSSTGCTPPSGGIPNSLAVEFDTYQNADDPNNNHVAIQSCGTGPNSIDSGVCRIADQPNPVTAGTVTTSGTTVTWAGGNLFNTSWAPGTGILINGAPFIINNVASTTSLTVTVAPPTYSTPTPYSVVITLADGNVHSVTITYAPPSGGSGPGTLDVILDNTDLFPGGVLFDLTSIGLNSGNAYIGFTAATGGGDDNQDILSWTFVPGGQSAVTSTTTQATLSFQNAAQTTVYDYTALLTSGSPVDVQIKPTLVTQSACDALVQKSFWPARCFVYENAENSGLDSSVMFEVTCPESQGGTCGSVNLPSFFAGLGTDFQFSQNDNPFFVYPGQWGIFNPFPGWLKGSSGPDPLHPCTPPPTGPLFQSNQIDAFTIDGGKGHGGSGGGASCWVLTYDTPGEALPGIKITSPTFTTYVQNQKVPAIYQCSNPFTSKIEPISLNNPPGSSLVGPYLTLASCTSNAQNGFVNTSTLGFHTFLVTAIDTGGNTNVQVIIYFVKKH